MKELRCLVFSDQEVAGAVFDRRRKRAEAVPTGMVMGVTFHQPPAGEGGLEAMIRLTDDFGDDRVLSVDDTEIAAALVHHCMNRKIPLPVDSDKSVHVINGSATLMITMNFNRPPRMVPLASGDQRRDAAPAEGADLRALPQSARRMPRRP
jgi:hypothetical protein